MAVDGCMGPHVVVHPQSGLGIVTTDFDTRSLNEGLSFIANLSGTQVAASSTLSILATNPATGVNHLTVECESKKAGTFTLSEAPNATATGSSAITAANLNRRSSNTNTLVVVGNGTYTSSGTILETHVIGSTSGPNITTHRYVLKASTKYLARFVAAGTTTLTVLRCYIQRES
jgi:hypothetical protein